MADALTQALAQALRVYSPTTLSWTGPDGTSQVLNGTGGGLVEAVEQNGIAVLGQVVSAGCVLEMTDSGVQLEIRRDGSDLLLRVSWADGPAYEERIAVTVALSPDTPTKLKVPLKPPPSSSVTVTLLPEISMV